MSIENFIREALYNPNDYSAYHVGRELVEMHPGKSIIEGITWYFDIEAFVRAEKCSVIEQKSVFHHTRKEWRGAGKRFGEHIQNSWLNVLWNGQLLDVVLITWSEECSRRRHHWIIADDQQVAEAFFDAVCDWSCQVRGEILVYQDGYFERNKELFDSIKHATFDNLILPESLKGEIQNDFAQFFQSRELYDRYGIPWRRGAIFIGPPGNGKTHTLKALINDLAKPCLYVRSFKSEYATEQENMAVVFKRARMTPPCIVVLEDLDSMIDEANRAFFLNELDGFESNTGVVVLATTNHPEKLDTSIMDRPSRFDRKYYFELPDENERRRYLEKWNEKLLAEVRVSEALTQSLLKETEGFSFAYLKELFVASLAQWVGNHGSDSMDRIIAAQSRFLRAQMAAREDAQAKSDGG